MNYTVVEGDTLDNIARKFGVSTLDIISMNNLNSYFLTPGINLVIPSSSSSAFIDYTVQKGDSLYSISQKYNTDPVILAEINGLKLYDYIYPDQIIIVPRPNTSLYITKEGDTIRSLIEDNKLTFEDLARYNRNVTLVPGQLIVSVNNQR